MVGYAFTKLSNPASLPSLSLRAMAVSPDGNWILGWGTTGAVQTYQRQSDGSYAKVAVSGQITTVTQVRDAHFNADGSKIVVASAGGTVAVAVYSFNLSTGLLTAETVTSAPATVAYSCWWHPTLNYFVLGITGTTGGVQIWKLSAGAWVKVADDVVTMTSGNFTFVGWSSDGLRIIVRSTSGTPLTQCWTFNTGTDTLTVFSGTGFDTAPAGATSGQNGQGAVLPNGDLIMCIAAAPGITWYQWVSGNNRYEKKTVPTGLGAANGQGVAFNADSTHIVVAYPLTPFTVHYEISGSTMTQSSNQIATTDFPSGQPWNPRFIVDPEGMTLVCGVSVSPFIGLWSYRNIAKLQQSGFLPTTAIAGTTAPQSNVANIAASGFLPTTAIAAGTKQKATMVTASFLPTTAVAAGTRQKATMPTSGFLPTTAMVGLVQPDAVMRTSGFLPTTSIQAASKQRANLDTNGYLPQSHVNAGMKIKATLDVSGFLPTTHALGGAPKNVGNIAASGFLPTTSIQATTKQIANIVASGFLPTTHVVAYSKNLGAIDAVGFLPTTHIDANLPVAAVATMVTSGFLPTSKVVAFAEPQPTNEGGSGGPGFSSGGGLNLNGPVLGGGSALRVG